MENQLNWERPENTEVRWFFGEGWCPANRHNNGCIEAMNWGADYIMLAGSDHVTDLDVLVILKWIIDEKGWDMATGITTTRGVYGPVKKPYQYLSYKKKEGVPLPIVQAARMINTDKIWDVISKEDGSQEIHIIGSGCIMMRREVLETMPQPWFVDQVEPDSINFTRHATNDTAFVARATLKYGFRLWLATEINVWHLETMAIDETFADRFKDKDGIKRWSSIGSVMKQTTSSVP
jgi:hypothetical protein